MATVVAMRATSEIAGEMVARNSWGRVTLALSAAAAWFAWLSLG